MKYIIYILLFLYAAIGISQSNPQSKKITEKFFPEFEALENNTPALKKKKGYTNYEELIAFIHDLNINNPTKMTVEFIGKSQKGKKIPLLRFKNNSNTEKIKVWFQGGLHGNESGSTESMLFLAHALLNDSKYTSLLDHLELIIVPMANIDGYLKEDRYAANGLDLNRDQTKLMAPESKILKLAFSSFNPQVAVDFHEYKPYRKAFSQLGRFGITAAYDAMFLYSGNLNVPKDLRELTNNLFVQNARTILDENNYKHHDYFSSKSYGGEIHFNQGSNNARSSATSYALNNTISTLVEIRGVGIGKTSFKRRIHTSFLIAISYLETAAANKDKVKSTIRKAIQAQKEAFVTSKKDIYKDSILAIDLDKEALVKINTTIHDSWSSKPILTRERPFAYLLDASEFGLVKKLQILGAKVSLLETDKNYLVETYQIIEYDRNSRKYEKMNLQKVKTKVITKEVLFPKGTFYVSLQQQVSNLIIEVLEPEAPNSFVSFGVLETDKNKILPIYRLLN